MWLERASRIENGQVVGAKMLQKVSQKLSTEIVNGYLGNTLDALWEKDEKTDDKHKGASQLTLLLYQFFLLIFDQAWKIALGQD